MIFHLGFIKIVYFGLDVGKSQRISKVMELVIGALVCALQKPYVATMELFPSILLLLPQRLQDDYLLFECSN